MVMAMPKTLKKGTKSPERYQGTCRDCGSVIAWELSEINIERDRDGSLARVKCPECGGSMFCYPEKKSGFDTHGDFWQGR
jgi:hypothetical protein